MTRIVNALKSERRLTIESVHGADVFKRNRPPKAALTRGRSGCDAQLCNRLAKSP